MIYLEQCVITTGITDIGIRFVGLYSPNHGACVGMVHGMEVVDPGNGCRTFVVHGSYVHPKLRRQGIRSRLNDAIFANLDVAFIRSAGATDEGGREFMERTGYKRHADGSWYVTREVWEGRRGVHV